MNKKLFNSARRFAWHSLPTVPQSFFI